MGEDGRTLDLPAVAAEAIDVIDAARAWRDAKAWEERERANRR